MFNLFSPLAIEEISLLLQGYEKVGSPCGHRAMTTKAKS